MQSLSKALYCQVFSARSNVTTFQNIKTNPDLTTKQHLKVSYISRNFSYYATISTEVFVWPFEPYIDQLGLALPLTLPLRKTHDDYL